MSLLKIKNLHAKVGGNHILKGLDLDINPGEVHVVMGPNGAGKSTLAGVLTARQDIEIIDGSIEYDGKDLLKMSIDERAKSGIFLAFQYPVEIPGVSNANFMKTAVNEIRKYRGLQPLDAMDFIQLMRQKAALVGLDKKFLSRSVNEGFSGGEKKRNEIFQMAMLEPKLAILDEIDSGLDVDAIKTVAESVVKLRTKENSLIVITHYERLLDIIVPDFVHILYNGKIVKTGPHSLAKELDEKGYTGLSGLNQ